MAVRSLPVCLPVHLKTSGSETSSHRRGQSLAKRQTGHGLRIPVSENRHLHCEEAIIGANPRLPADLLSDDPTDLVGLLIDNRMLWRRVGLLQLSPDNTRLGRRPGVFSSLDAKRKLAVANHAARHCDQTFHKDKLCLHGDGRQETGNSRILQLVLRDWWVEPQLVMLHSEHTVRVSMRTRLWKCRTQQLRLATHPEALGVVILDDREMRQLQLTKSGQGSKSCQPDN